MVHETSRIQPPGFERQVKPELESPSRFGLGNFFVPAGLTNALLLCSPNTKHSDTFHPFSSQFYSPGELGTSSILAFSPAVGAVDPNLLDTNAKSAKMSPSPLGKRYKAAQGAICAPVPRMISLNELVEPASTSLTSRPRNEHKPASIRGGGRRTTKRYQYWTQEEDDLVRDLREQAGWTWKDISSELHRRLGGVHTWQAVQMRYLRTNKKSVQPKLLRRRPHPGVPGVVYPEASVPSASAEAPSAIVARIDETVDYAELEKAIMSDWEGRWLRISARLGIDVNTIGARGICKGSLTSATVSQYMGN